MFQSLSGYKTYIVAAVTVAYALTGMFMGFLDATTAIQMILAALATAGLRHGIAMK